MLEFTEDPEWQRKREAAWGPIEDHIKEGLTRRRVKQFKQYFMTGRIPEGVHIPPADAVEHFPVPTIEGIRYCLRENYSREISDEEYGVLVRQLSVNVNTIYGMLRGEQVKLFAYVMGERYEKVRDFPFAIGGEKKQRKISYEPEKLLRSALIKIDEWLSGDNYFDQAPFWTNFTNYLSSLLSHAGKGHFKYKLYVSGELKRPKSKEALTLKLTCSIIRKMEQAHKDPKNCQLDDEKKAFLGDFRKELNAVEKLPGDLEKIRREIQIQEGTVTPSVIENFWRRLRHKGDPNGQ
ncbi:hypothetical protein [Marinobacter sp. NFXS9]|uniref:hypothetical protein n=1 Tax=Marinobacter sp. NFXS9 TaxID=2818433 RepID=UPI0032DE4677